MKRLPLVISLAVLFACDPPSAVQTVCQRGTTSQQCTCTTFESTVGAELGDACDSRSFAHCCLGPGTVCQCSTLSCTPSQREVTDCRVASATNMGGTTACHPNTGGCGSSQQCVPTPSSTFECRATGGAGIGANCTASASSTGCVSDAFCASDGKCHRFCETNAECGSGKMCVNVNGFPSDVRLCN